MSPRLNMAYIVPRGNAASVSPGIAWPLPLSGLPAAFLREFPDTNNQLLGLQNKQSLLPLFLMLRLDYLSCALTILSTCLVSRRMWQGWVVASVNSVIICVIGFRTAQLGFVPANLFCLALYVHAIYKWKSSPAQTASPAKLASHMSRQYGKAACSRSGSSARAVLHGVRVRSSSSSTRVPGNDEQFARSSDRALSRTLPARP